MLDGLQRQINLLNLDNTLVQSNGRIDRWYTGAIGAYPDYIGNPLVATPKEIMLQKLADLAQWVYLATPLVTGNQIAKSIDIFTGLPKDNVLTATDTAERVLDGLDRQLALLALDPTLLADGGRIDVWYQRAIGAYPTGVGVASPKEIRLQKLADLAQWVYLASPLATGNQIAKSIDIFTGLSKDNILTATDTPERVLDGLQRQINLLNLDNTLVQSNGRIDRWYTGAIGAYPDYIGNPLVATPKEIMLQKLADLAQWVYLATPLVTGNQIAKSIDIFTGLPKDNVLTATDTAERVLDGLDRQLALLALDPTLLADGGRIDVWYQRAIGAYPTGVGVASPKEIRLQKLADLAQWVYLASPLATGNQIAKSIDIFTGLSKDNILTATDTPERVLDGLQRQINLLNLDNTLVQSNGRIDRSYTGAIGAYPDYIGNPLVATPKEIMLQKLADLAQWVYLATPLVTGNQIAKSIDIFTGLPKDNVLTATDTAERVLDGLDRQLALLA